MNTHLRKAVREYCDQCPYRHDTCESELCAWMWVLMFDGTTQDDYYGAIKSGAAQKIVKEVWENV